MRETRQTLWGVMLMVVFAVPGVPNPATTTKLDPVLQTRVGQLTGLSRVVVTASNASALTAVSQLILKAIDRLSARWSEPERRSGRPPCGRSWGSPAPESAWR